MERSRWIVFDPNLEPLEQKAIHANPQGENAPHSTWQDGSVLDPYARALGRLTKKAPSATRAQVLTPNFHQSAPLRLCRCPADRGS